LQPNLQKLFSRCFRQNFSLFFVTITLVIFILLFSSCPLLASPSSSFPAITTILLEDFLHMAKLKSLLMMDPPTISGPDSSSLEPYLGLQENQRDNTKYGPIHRLQKLLLGWNKNLPIKITGEYDKATCMSVTLYKLVHDCDDDGTRIDRDTAYNLLALENGWKVQSREPTLVAQVLNEAVKFLGIRYRLGGGGVKYIDCGMFTRMAMISAGIAEKIFNRTAAMQYKYAEQGDMGLFLRKSGETPQPGDLVFFNWRTRFQKRRYKGITHVGFFLGKVGDSMLVLEAASRGERKVTIKDRADSMSCIAGFAQIVGAPGSFDLFNLINTAAEDLERLMVPRLGGE
jgi:hypothetical protein